MTIWLVGCVVTEAAVQALVIVVFADAFTSAICWHDSDALLVIVPVGALRDTSTVKLTLPDAPGTSVPMSHVNWPPESLGQVAVAGSQVRLVTVTFAGKVSTICTPVALLNPGAPGAAVFA